MLHINLSASGYQALALIVFAAIIGWEIGKFIYKIATSKRFVRDSNGFRNTIFVKKRDIERDSELFRWITESGYKLKGWR